VEKKNSQKDLPRDFRPKTGVQGVFSVEKRKSTIRNVLLDDLGGGGASKFHVPGWEKNFRKRDTRTFCPLAITKEKKVRLDDGRN